ncbi:MAG: polysaccharide deacetylase family protein [Steroidobacteraceae bacterium]
MLEGARIGLKVDVDTLRGTREGVPRLMALLKKLKMDTTFYFSVGPDHTGRALRRVFRKGFAQKVARTSVLKHYGVKTLLYGVLLPGPDIGRRAGGVMRGAYDAGFEVGLHTYDHVRWQDYVADATAAWTRTEFERGLAAFERVFGFPPQSHAAAGWQINAHGLELEREYGLAYASDTRGGPPFLPQLGLGVSDCPQLPTTLPTFDEILGLDGVDESNVAEAVFRLSAAAAAASDQVQVFTLHAELEGMLLLPAFERLLVKWRDAGALITRMAKIRELAMRRTLPARAVVMGEIKGRSGRLAVQAESTVA